MTFFQCRLFVGWWRHPPTINLGYWKHPREKKPNEKDPEGLSRGTRGRPGGTHMRYEYEVFVKYVVSHPQTNKHGGFNWPELLTTAQPVWSHPNTADLLRNDSLIVESPYENW
uniref:Uncharacterized protein n=1 Tax=Picea sitchensis TaxID=3332 RepID=A0A6B9XPT4_PICSI|nr:hypothetical protein Q903MT_gene4012 [Picea sitchensis]